LQGKKEGGGSSEYPNRGKTVSLRDDNKRKGGTQKEYGNWKVKRPFIGGESKGRKKSRVHVFRGDFFADDQGFKEKIHIRIEKGK